MDDASQATEDIVKGVKNYHDASIKLQAIEEQYFSDLDKLKELQAGKKLEYGAEDEFGGDALIKYYSSRTKSFDKQYTELKQEIAQLLYLMILKLYLMVYLMLLGVLNRLFTNQIQDFLAESRN